MSPTDWHSHFSSLLAQQIDPTNKQNLDEIISENVELFKSKLDDPISEKEFDHAIKDLKNNKASSFDRITNEILKTSGKIYKKAFLHLFNAIAKVCSYPENWKKRHFTPNSQSK